MCFCEHWSLCLGSCPAGERPSRVGELPTVWVYRHWTHRYFFPGCCAETGRACGLTNSLCSSPFYLGLGVSKEGPCVSVLTETTPGLRGSQSRSPVCGSRSPRVCLWLRYSATESVCGSCSYRVHLWLWHSSTESICGSAVLQWSPVCGRDNQQWQREWSPCAVVLTLVVPFSYYCWVWFSLFLSADEIIS